MDAELKQAMREVMQYLVDRLRDRLETQGHRLTGKAIQSMSFTVDLKNEMLVGEVEMEFYTQFLERGVARERIPFGGRTGRGGVSKYIQALADFFRKRGVPEREVLGAAFATAHKHKREGMPTRAAGRFSRDNGGARTGFITRTMEQAQPAIVTILGNRVEQLVSIRIENQFTNVEGYISI